MLHARDCASHVGHACDCGAEGPLRARALDSFDFSRLRNGDHFTGPDGRDFIKLAEHATACVAA